MHRLILGSIYELDISSPKEDQNLNFRQCTKYGNKSDRQKILRTFCHIIRINGSSLEKLTIEGTIEENSSHRITPIHWIYHIKTITNYTLNDAICSQKTVTAGKRLLPTSIEERSSNFRFWKMYLRRRCLGVIFVHAFV